MRKVLVVVTVALNFNGIANHVLTYIRNMNKENLQVDLLSTCEISTGIQDRIKEAGFSSIYRLEYRNRHPLQYFWDLRNLVKRNQYDIVHVHGNSSTLAIDLLAAAWGGAKVRIAHSHNSSCTHAVLNKILKPLFYMSYTQGFACSRVAGDWMFGKRPYKIIHNAIDLNRFAFHPEIRNEIRNKLGIREDQIALGHVANFAPAKNHEFVVELMQEMEKEQPDKYILFLFGDGGEKKTEILNLIKDRKLQSCIRYMGAVNNLQDYLQAMDIMILPSYYEGFPSVPEWQASGLPCILSDRIPRNADILSRAHYLPIDQGVGPWGSQIQTILQHEDRIAQLGSVEMCFNQAEMNIAVEAQKLRKYYLSC